jgi:CheY-like chemotaxis protein
VIDDEPDIAVLAGQILKRGGYAPRVYTNPREALSALQADPQSCDLVLTDLTMPGMTGLEVAKELRKFRPDLPIVLCTGFGHDLDGSALNEAGIRAKLTKPFSVKALYELLNRLLSV